MKEVIGKRSLSLPLTCIIAIAGIAVLDLAIFLGLHFGGVFADMKAFEIWIISLSLVLPIVILIPILIYALLYPKDLVWVEGSRLFLAKPKAEIYFAEIESIESATQMFGINRGHYNLNSILIITTKDGKKLKQKYLTNAKQVAEELRRRVGG
jgi:hypothetical protein